MLDYDYHWKYMNKSNAYACLQTPTKTKPKSNGRRKNKRKHQVKNSDFERETNKMSAAMSAEKRVNWTQKCCTYILNWALSKTGKIELNSTIHNKRDRKQRKIKNKRRIHIYNIEKRQKNNHSIKVNCLNVHTHTHTYLCWSEYAREIISSFIVCVCVMIYT